MSRNEIAQPEITWPANLATMSESAFQRDILSVAAVRGWTHFHAQYSLGNDAGYPDLTLVHPQHGVLWAELKSDLRNHQATPMQLHWLGLLREAGQRAFLWRPAYAPCIGLLLQGWGDAEARVVYPDIWAAMIAASTPAWLATEERTR